MSRFIRKLNSAFRGTASMEKMRMVYWAILGRDIGEADDIEKMQEQGFSVSELLERLFDSDEYQQICSKNSLADPEDINQYYLMVYGRLPSDDEKAYLIDEKYSKGRLLLQLYMSKEDKSPLDYIVDQEDVFNAYMYLLGRAPSAEEISANMNNQISLGTLFKRIWVSVEFKSLTDKGANAVIDAEAVSLAYQVLLGRKPTAEEISITIQQQFSIGAFLHHIWKSEEFQKGINAVKSISQQDIVEGFCAILGRVPDSHEVSDYHDARLTVGAFLTKLWLSQEFEHREKFNSALTSDNIVTLYQVLLGRKPRQDEQDGYLDNRSCLSSLLLQVWNSEEFHERAANVCEAQSEHVALAYRSLLGRSPKEEEIRSYVDSGFTTEHLLRKLWDSDECKAVSGARRTVDAEDIQQGYNVLLGKSPGGEELDYYLSRQLCLGEFLQKLWDSEDSSLKKDIYLLQPPKREDIVFCYYALLGRYPSKDDLSYYEGSNTNIVALLVNLWRSEQRKKNTSQLLASNSYRYGISTDYCIDGNRFCLVFNKMMSDDITKAAERGDFIWEDENRYINLFSRPGYFLDIGANIGAVTMLLASKGWSGFAIEASPENVECLKRSLMLNGFSVTVGEYAVSDQTGTIQFVENGPWGSVQNEYITRDLGNSQRAFADVKTIDIPCVCLDDWKESYARMGDIRHIDLIKMDIEGSELFALAGMKRFLEHFSFPPVFSEINGYNLFTFHKTPKDMFRAFLQLGYRPYKLFEEKLIPFHTDCFQVEVFDNYLFLHDSYQGFDSIKSAEPLPYNESDLANTIAYNLGHGWSLVQKHLLYSLKDYPEFMKHEKITGMLDQYLSSDLDEVTAAAIDWYKHREKKED